MASVRVRTSTRSGAKVRGQNLQALERLFKLRWLPIRHWFDLRQAMRLHVAVRDREDGLQYRFVADSLHSYQRARSHLSKEPETIRWLRQNLRPADVFLDIGANIGTFSIFAAKHISDQGRVYACEPHLPTAVQLLENIALNELEDRVSVISIAASSKDSFVPFRYKRWRQGASGSQLDVEGGPAMKGHVGTELKSGLRVDTMIAQAVIRPPSLIKIDTDGIELQILSGMPNLLRSEKKPRSILVEIQPGERQQQMELMRSYGYALVATHVVGKSQRLFEAGSAVDELAVNGVYEPVT
jgi:FkbM family methyltransferase